MANPARLQMPQEYVCAFYFPLRHLTGPRHEAAEVSSIAAACVRADLAAVVGARPLIHGSLLDTGD